MDAAERFAADEALERFDAKGELAERQGPLVAEAATPKALKVRG